MTAPATVLFDIDGTLVDSNYFHAVAWRRAFRRTGADIAMADVHRCVGMGAGQLLDTLLPARERSQDDVVKQAHSDHYREFWPELTAFRGAPDLVRAVAERGGKAVLATSAQPDEVDALRKVLQVDDAVAEIVASGDVGAPKPQPDVVQVALDKAGCDASRAVMVGDTVWDIEAARRAGVPCICVLTGGIARQVLEEAGAVAVYADVAALLDELDTSPVGRLLDGEDPYPAGRPGGGHAVGADQRTALPPQGLEQSAG